MQVNMHYWKICGSGGHVYHENICCGRTYPVGVRVLQVCAEAATIEAATIEAATIEAATIEAATIEPATIEAATIEAATIEPATIEAATIEAAVSLGSWCFFPSPVINFFLVFERCFFRIYCFKCSSWVCRFILWFSWFA